MRDFSDEEEMRRLKEYGSILRGFSLARANDHCEIKHQYPYGEPVPGAKKQSPYIASYPRLILEWQTRECLLNRDAKPTFLVERRSELCKKLVYFIFAKDFRISEEYLKKLCEKGRAERIEESTRPLATKMAESAMSHKTK